MFALAVSTIAAPCLAFTDEGLPPALRLGHIGHDFSTQGQCFPADGVFQVAFNESGNVHYLIARADCYAAFGSDDLALEGFEWARDSDTATRAGEQNYISRTIARLGAEATTQLADAAETELPEEMETTEPEEPNGYLYASAMYRMEDLGTVPVPQADLTLPHVGAEWGWYPLRGRLEAGHGLGIFARAYASVDTDSVRIQDETLQAGVGLRLQPFRFADLVLRGEWLIPIGEDAREGWMLSAAHDWGVGGNWRSTYVPWIIADTHLEAAWLPEEPEFVSINGETILGLAIPMTERIAFLPHGVGSVRYSEDETMHEAVGEAGLGIGLRYWFDGGGNDANEGAIDVLLQYRWFFLEDTTIPLAEDGTWVGRVIVRR